MKKAVFRRIILTAAGLAALTWAAVPANAQISRERAAIPFAFTAGSLTVPAGEYWVTVNSNHGVLRFQAVKSVDNYSLMLLGSTEKRGLASLEKGQLRFLRSGDRYFLRAVFTTGKDLGNQVSLPKVLLEASNTRTGSTSVTTDIPLK